MTKTFSINDIPEFSKKERIVVVGVIGKSTYRYPNKTTPLIPNVQCKENGIECHWDERKGILYLHAVTYLDTNRLVTLANELDENSHSTVKDADAADWLVASGELAIESCKALALIFHLCHIVVLSSPTHVFDLGYLQLFKAIDAYRAELAAQAAEELQSSGAGGAWETHGRPCCPRLLFHFRRAPTPLRKAPAALKRLEHAVEDQIYFILRKARIITNVCAKSLFAIPKNEEFVYISAESDRDCARDVSSLIRGLVQLCAGTEPEGQPQRSSFRQFLQGHLDLAFGEGFEDNVGKYAMSTSFFELPSATSWRCAARALAPLYLRAAPSEGDTGALFDALATDVRFSQARCAKVLPIAQASYAEGLPPHYSSQHHAHKVGVALCVVEAMARGPLAAGARERLRAACSAVWRARRLCEAPSLTAHPCIHPQHDSSKEHSSGVRYVSACNCGRAKCSRDDPYTVKKANYTFYVYAADECGVCNTLQSIDFPVFQPSTPSFRAASVKSTSDENDADNKEAADDESPAALTSPSRSWSPPDELSPGSARDDDDDEPPACDDALELVAVHRANEKVISRQPSTTEYLPGMLHTASPAALLPAFPSWALLCLGASSLYSHSAGLPEHMQPGFLPHTNYLMPWDCAVRLDWRPRTRRPPYPHAHAHAHAHPHAHPQHAHPQHAHAHPAPLTVKIFIGFEYECPRGHRFMMSSPDTVMSGGGGAWTREAHAAGARLASSDMPLYAACVCRAHVLAQLTRLHVVTPKAPVHVTLDPKVQPVAGGPVFTPQPAGSEPLRLSASAYWVLRFPYVYADERGPAPRPRLPLHAPGALLAPLFGLQE
ncbi:unnamed protein product [Euphydryas editha]|uniref:Nonsense-mediated mRNA decay factor SMG8 n=1 Tax=Euphydryas editha TaxID=104508 RepID=A0AAU9TIP7_EUPED|nr:unnamed protein product [Euphydryas editha]